MAYHFIDKNYDLSRDVLKINKDIEFTLERTHEICGNSRRNFALWLATKILGTIIWIRPSWISDQLLPGGVINWVNPGRVVTISVRRTDEMLWVAEETLRFGSVSLIVIESTIYLELKSIRRLNLSAEIGRKEKNNQALCLLLTQGKGGTPGVESRWSMSAKHNFNETKWELECLKSRHQPLSLWELKNTNNKFTLDKK
ncbi:MAG: hypothetical protein O3A45_04960 [Proteobacteria bacterium]|jgi:protein ImuA|nr:hypothetical protein [Pseudomonadota bacterium]MDA1238085.1 hypothetical protein [Pseudomonadota bacterium]